MTGTSNIVPTIVSLGFGANCMPVVGPDPVFGSVFVEYDNQGTGNGNMNIVQSELSFVNAMEGWVFPIQLSPTASGSVAPSSILASEHVKVATQGDSSFICQLCGQSGQLSLRFVDDQGLEASATQPFDLGCAL